MAEVHASRPLFVAAVDLSAHDEPRLVQQLLDTVLQPGRGWDVPVPPVVVVDPQSGGTVPAPFTHLGEEPPYRAPREQALRPEPVDEAGGPTLAADREQLERQQLGAHDGDVEVTDRPRRRERADLVGLGQRGP